MSTGSTKRESSQRKSASKNQRDPSPPRDWLAEYARDAQLDNTAIRSVREWLAEQFIGDEYAQLGNAGHGDTQIPLRQVFVDLPMTVQPGGRFGHSGETTPFLNDVLSFKPQSLVAGCDGLRDETGVFRGIEDLGLDAESHGVILRGKNSVGARGGARRPRHNNNSASIVGCGAVGAILIGGPGQGKSTLCQLLCQLHRAALLRGDSRSMTTLVRDVLTPFEHVEARGAFKLPREPLFPVRIVLPDASTWLAKSLPAQTKSDGSPVLLTFLASQASAKKAKLSAKTLGALLDKMPFLLLLDGFDEIGAAEDRKRIVEAIRDLIVTFAKRSAKATVVATTRPQGYTGELNGIGVPLVTRYLAPLTTEEALAYASKLLDEKIKGVDERKKTLDKLHEAAKEPATSRLLQTPLQVTILAGLVQRGSAPSERWKLFENYLRFVYDREVERSIAVSELLKSRRAQIESIHARAALLLQVEAETSGGASSKMSRQRFETIVNEVLAAEGINDEERAELVARIVKVAENRLVFLVEPEPGFFGFEIRSLQEFMAAWSLVVDAPEARVERRILQIAKAPLFRNVLLFITSKVFGGGSALREYIAKNVCASLDEDASDLLAQTTKAGAMLALEVLEEGAVLPSARFARDLMSRAVGLLDLPPAEIHSRLVRVANKDTEKVLIEAIEKRIANVSGDDESHAMGSWVCLVEGANVGHPWAARLADTYWSHVRKPSGILEACHVAQVQMGEWLLARINETPETIVPAAYFFPFGMHLGWHRPPQHRPLHVSIDEWLRVSDTLQDNQTPFSDPEPTTAITAYLAEPTNAGWISVLVDFASHFAATLIPNALRVQLKEQISTQQYSAPEAQRHVSIIRMWLGDLGEPAIDSLLQHLAQDADTKFDDVVDIVGVIQRSDYTSATRESLLTRWYALAGQSLWRAHRTIRAMTQALQSRRSGLDNHNTWDQLDLPPPYPHVRTAEAARPWIPEKPIVLQKLHIQHVRGIHDLEIEFEPPAAGKGQWIVLLGPNGAGKTTILRSLSLALRNLGDPKIWPKGTWMTPWREFGQQADARIAVTIESRGEQTTRLQNGAERPRQDPAQTEPRLFPLFAYGCRRGSALGGEATAVDLGDDGGPEIATLFHEGAGLVHAETWLKDWSGEALRDPQNSKPIYDAVQNALKHLLDVDDVFVKDRQVHIVEKGGRTIPFAALSDGYITTAGWFIDLLARWIELCKKAGNNIGHDFMLNMRGLVLIDEIDLHLHPKWQVESIRRARHLLPEMSFVVTTHNPLTLVGAKPEEIHILKIRDHKVVAERGKERPMLLTGGEIFNQYFEVEDIFPAAVGRKLQRYGFLSGDSMRNDDEEKELYALKKDLAEEGIAPSWNIVEQSVPPGATTEDAARPKPSRRRKTT